MKMSRNEAIYKLSWVINEHSLWEAFAAARDQDVLLFYFSLNVMLNRELGDARESYIVAAEKCANNILSFYLESPHAPEERVLLHRAAEFVLDSIEHLRDKQSESI